MESFDILNKDVLNIIFEFIPTSIKFSLNKDFYKANKRNISIPDTFLRNIIRLDYSFIFEYHLVKKYKKWRKITRWIYKNMTFHNYVEYIRYLCIEYESSKCKKLLIIFEKKINPKKKKKYKRIGIRNTRWSN